MTAVAQVANPSAIAWRDPHLQQDSEPHWAIPAVLRSQFAALTAKHEHLISNILQVQDLQCAWILLLHCASAWANCSLRVVHPKLTDAFAAQHDASMRSRESVIHQGGMGLRSAALTSRAAHWSSPKSRCGRHDRHRDGSGRRRVPCQWSI